MGEKVTGGVTNYANLVNLSTNNGDSKTFFMKVGSHNPFMKSIQKKVKLHKEALFYDFLNKREEPWQHFNYPKAYLAVGNPETGRNIIMMEYFEGTRDCLNVFGHWNYKIRPN